MAVFLGDSAFYLGMIVIGFGITLLYFSIRENSKLLKVGGYLLSIVGALGVLCTGYYSMKYYLAGYYESPYPFHMMQGYGNNGQMMPMMQGMMSPGMMGNMGMGMPFESREDMQECFEELKDKSMSYETMQKMHDCMMQHYRDAYMEQGTKNGPDMNMNRGYMNPGMGMDQNMMQNKR